MSTELPVNFTNIFSVCIIAFIEIAEILQYSYITCYKNVFLDIVIYMLELRSARYKLLITANKSIRKLLGVKRS